ncbi:MAG: SDR family oxidoreductase, partial [Anaerolineales bacterium]|nr:SDR family oxidoreductase [Anaerolineales bacterium]
MKRVVLITGAAGGIGRATVEVFDAAGWETIAVDRQPAGDFPSGVILRESDVAIPESVAQLFQWLRQKTDRLDALVNNAAIQICK